MPTIAEATNADAHLMPPEYLGIEALSAQEVVTFTQYNRLVLPLDGFVFWVAAGTVSAKGSLHYATTRHQNEDETIAINRVIFSAEAEVTEFNQISSDTIFVGAFPTPDYLTDESGNIITNEAGSSSFTTEDTALIQFSFSRRGRWYQQAQVYHYDGDAVYPALASQLITDPSQLDQSQAIVSDSLPVWLALKTYNPIWLAPTNPAITLYPSYLVPDNIAPPYGVVHHYPDGIRALQGMPSWDANASHYQLTAERVAVTLYGCNNQVALDFMDLVLQYSRDTSNIGIMAPPVVRDEKRVQTELMTIAQKKRLEFEVSYNQTRMNTIARQLIDQATATIQSQWLPIMGTVAPPTFEAIL